MFFQNAGAKLKGLAKIIFAFYVIIALILGGIIASQTSFLVFIVFLITGVVGGWLSSIMLYAFGELCENVHSINSKLQNNSDRT